jgi:hypothetical protein
MRRFKRLREVLQPLVRRSSAAPWMAASADTIGSVQAARSSLPRLAATQLSGTGLVALLAVQCLAGNFDPELFARAFSPPVLRSKTFSDVDQALLFAIDNILAMWGGDSFGGRLGMALEVDGAESRTRLPLDVRELCRRKIASYESPTIPLYSKLHTLFKRSVVSVSMQVPVAGWVLPMGIPSSRICLELSGPWNRAPPDSVARPSRQTNETHGGPPMAMGAEQQVRWRREPALLSRLLEVHLAAAGWSLHRIHFEDLDNCQFTDALSPKPLLVSPGELELGPNLREPDREGSMMLSPLVEDPPVNVVSRIRWGIERSTDQRAIAAARSRTEQFLLAEVAIAQSNHRKAVHGIASLIRARTELASDIRLSYSIDN